MTQLCDVAIVGAGAAGIAAARRLAPLPLRVRIFEARNRIGGRAWTVSHSGFSLDLGCGWLHSANENDWLAIANKLHLQIDRSAPPWSRLAYQGQVSLTEQVSFRNDLNSFFARLASVNDGTIDRPAAEFLDPQSKWNNLINAVSTYINGVELDRLSALDFNRYHDTGVNFRASQGFGTLIQAYAGDMQAELNCPVTSIDHSTALVNIVTLRGKLAARAAIITVPTNLIAEEAIAFFPALPEKVEAASCLPLGLANKAFLLAREGTTLPAETRFFGALDRTATGSYHTLPLGRPIIEGYFGGTLARELEKGEDTLGQFALEEIGSVLGVDIKSKLQVLTTTAWASEPFSRGSYSYAKVGYSHAREILAQPVNEKLFFAGEGTSIHDFSTAHGAYRTGLRAADEVTRVLGKTVSLDRDKTGDFSTIV